MDKPLSILIVDDDLGMLQTLNYILTDKGYEVVTVKDGYEAIEKIQEKKFDLALSDIKMPGMNGIEVLKEIKRLSPKTTTVMMTAYTMHEQVKEAKKEGAKEIFTKPLDLDKVISYTEEFKANKNKTVQDSVREFSQLLQLLEEREKEIQEKDQKLEELQKELSDIKNNPSALLEEERKKIQSDNIHEVLKPKQYELFNILAREEKTYDEILETVQNMDLNIRDLAALRLQMSRLNNRLQRDTIFKIERTRRDKHFYFKISSN